MALDQQRGPSGIDPILKRERALLIVTTTAIVIANACASDDAREPDGAAGAGGDRGGSSAGFSAGGIPAQGGAGAAGASGDLGGAGASGGEPQGGAPSGGEAGASGTAGAGGEGGGEVTREPRDLLSQTGLYLDLAASEELAEGVEPYRPRYELWSDAATKRRWLWLPPGAAIDTSDMDYWSYPRGTRLWKEFSRDGVRIETRLMEKVGEHAWNFMAYHWNAEQKDAVAVPRGVPNASGTEHDIPSHVDCGICHENMPDRVLGATAIQLSHAFDGVSLSSLVADGRLTQPPAGSFELPGDAVAQAALGTLHANCGLCHNPRSTVFATVRLELWLAVSDLASVETTASYRTTVGIPFDGVSPSPDVPALRITAGDPAKSALYFRMNSRDALLQMPPIATERPDTAGLAAVSAWIHSLAAESAR